MSAIVQVDWSQCPLVEVKPKVLSGAPVLRGTRMPVSAIVDNFEYGLSVAEIAEQFEISVRQEPSRCTSCSIRTSPLACGAFSRGTKCGPLSS